MSAFLQDLRFAARALARRPGFTAVGVFILALGIGACSAMFSLAHALLLEPLPFRDADRVMVLSREVRDFEQAPFSFPVVEDLQARNRTFETLAVFVEESLNLTGADGEPERLGGLLVSAEIMAALGVEPAAGRGIVADDDRPQAQRSVMLSHELWSRRFGADERIFDEQILLDGQSYDVLGVLPPELSRRKLGPYRIGDFWIPIELFRDRLPRRREESPGLFMVGRLRPEATVEAARQDVARISRELAEEFSQIHKHSKIVAVPIFEDTVGEVRPVLRLLLGAVGFVLAIACANLANLLLARTAQRRSEFATRTALGAGRPRLVRQVLTETLLLGLLGGAFGLLLAYLAAEGLSTVVGAGELGFVQASISGPVFAFAAALCLAAVALVGAVPALEASRASFRQSLATRSSGPRQLLRRFLVAFELAVAVTLLIGALLMLGSLSRLRQEDPGFEPRGVLSLQASLPMPEYEEAAAWTGFFDRALAEVSRLPGVRGAAATSCLPMVLGYENATIVVAGDRPMPPTPEMSNTLYQTVSAGYFRSMGIPLVSGRDFTPFDDGDGKPVAIINQSLARHFWPGPDGEPIGQRIAFEFEGTPEAPRPYWREVIGVVGDVRHASLRTSSRHSAYAPYTQPLMWFEGEWPVMALVVKTDADPMTLAKPVRERLLAVDPDQPVDAIQPLDRVLEAELGSSRTIFALLGAFALLAVILAVVGVYAVIAQTVTAATREIGTRVALGARPAQVAGGLLRHSFYLVLAGVAAGLALAVAASRFMSSVLYEVGAVDAPVYASSAFFLALVALLATLVPAWRAARIDPSVALREE